LRFRRNPPRRRLGLRARLTLTYALGAGLLSALLAVTTFGLTRQNLLKQREDSAVARAFTNAVTVRRQLGTAPPSGSVKQDAVLLSYMNNVIASLPTPEGAEPVIDYQGKWYAKTVQFGQDALPPALRETVQSDMPARMRFNHAGQTFFAVGVPIGIDAVHANYFEAVSFSEIGSTLDTLALILIGGSIVTTVAGGFLGWWAARRALAPLLDVGAAAEAIAGGRLDTRLLVGEDPDLDILAVPFNHMAQALEDRVERDARFASEVSHELRSPLMTLAASVEVLENSRGEIPERAQTALDLLSADVDRFQQLVEDLLEISRFDAGAIKLHFEEVLVAEMVIQAVSVLGAGGIPVRYDDEVDVVVVRVDKRRFARVLANLLDNADKYAGGATDVTIELLGEVVQIAISDRGNGVPEAERDVIFDRFSRGSESGNRASDSGVGLGLALVDEHVRLHGGQVWVENRRDRLSGARFVVELPIVPLPSADDAAALSDVVTETPDSTMLPEETVAP
jgi:two-component system, OmpR family, sensor histidine kinase MtrB